MSGPVEEGGGVEGAGQRSTGVVRQGILMGREEGGRDARQGRVHVCADRATLP